MVAESRKTKADLRYDIMILKARLDDVTNLYAVVADQLEDKDTLLGILSKDNKRKKDTITVLLWSTIVLFSLLILSLTI